MTVPTALKGVLAFGTGVGIEVAGNTSGVQTLHVAAARVRGGAVQVLGELFLDDIPNRAAGSWGSDYAAMLRKFGLGHVPATVILPRRDVTVRQLSLPGVSDKDLSSAIQFQMDGLHPYREEEAVASWARIPGTSSVLIAVTRSAVIERLTNLFAEAGIKIGCFTCSAAAIYSARHLSGKHDAGKHDAGKRDAGKHEPGSLVAGVLAYQESAEGAAPSVEIYGESAARPIFSALFDVPAERAAALGAAEMRVDANTPLERMQEIVGGAPALPLAGAVMSACPLLSLPLNVLPAAQRQTSSRGMWIPVAALALFVALVGGALGAFPAYERRTYLKTLDAEIARVQPVAERSGALDKKIDAARRNITLLDGFRARSKADMDVLGELTKILPPPTWVNVLEVNRSQVIIGGASAQAAGLLGVIDNSPLFEQSEFQAAPARVNNEDTFRIRTKREAGK